MVKIYVHYMIIFHGYDFATRLLYCTQSAIEFNLCVKVVSQDHFGVEKNPFTCLFTFSAHYFAGIQPVSQVAFPENTWTSRYVFETLGRKNN